jgi:hypothetical protein
MINVRYERPFEIRNRQHYSHKGKANTTCSSEIVGSTIETYEANKLVGEIKALIEALNDAPCTAAIDVVVDTSGVRSHGHISVWEFEFAARVRQAVAELEVKAWALHRISLETRLELNYRLTRMVTSDAA